MGKDNEMATGTIGCLRDGCRLDLESSGLFFFLFFFYSSIRSSICTSFILAVLLFRLPIRQVPPAPCSFFPAKIPRSICFGEPSSLEKNSACSALQARSPSAAATTPVIRLSEQVRCFRSTP